MTFTLLLEFLEKMPVKTSLTERQMCDVHQCADTRRNLGNTLAIR